MSNKLTFDYFQSMSLLRSRQSFRGADARDAVWWCNALAGEVGEACNIAKKMSRGMSEDTQTNADLARELADVVTYAALLASHIGINLGDAVASKFNEVSVRVGSPLRLSAEEPNE